MFLKKTIYHLWDRLFLNEQKKLRTSIVALFIVCLVLLSMSVVYQMREAGNNTAIHVQHVFKPSKPVTEEKTQPTPMARKSNSPNSETKETVSKKIPQKVQTFDEQTPVKKTITKQDETKSVKHIPKPALKESVKKVRHETNKIRPSPKKHPGILKTEKKKQSVKVSQDLYQQIHHAWMTAEKKDHNQFHLRIENLPNAYSCFQMKPIAISKSRWFDLTEGLNISKNALDNYASTVFESSNPWDDWYDQLRSAGFTPDDNIQIRYYMYSFIKDKLFATASLSLECCQSKGLIASGVSPEKMTILGKTYVVNRDGGGRIGVFVPTRINIMNGKSVEVDVECFEKQLEINILRQAGLL